MGRNVHNINMASDEPSQKRIRFLKTKVDTNSIDDRLKILKSELDCTELLEVYLSKFCGGDVYVVEPLKLWNTNAAARKGVPFSRAFCDVDLVDKNGVMFGNFFIHGLRILKEFLSEPTKLPENEDEKALLWKLLYYLKCGRLFIGDHHESESGFLLSFRASVTNVIKELCS